MKVINNIIKSKCFIYILIFLILIGILFTVMFIVKKNNNSTSSDSIVDYSKQENNEENVNNLEKIEKDLKLPKSIEAAIPIFMYHFVRDDTGDYEYPENMVKPSTLREQLQYLKDNGFETIYISDLENLQSYSKPVALTFDDGWQDFYINAFPIFKEFNMKSTLYVITGLVGTPGYCTLDELKELKASGIVDIQCHTVTHPRLATLSDAKIVQEIEESKKYLKDNLDIDSDTICYPYGSFNDKVITLSKNAGYTYGLAMDGGVYYTNKHKDIYSIPRIYANRSMTLATFANYCKKSQVNVTW